MNCISVIIPVYNVEKYLKKCIDSVINQTYENLEIILVDDGSTDNSPQICDDYAALDGRIKVIHQKNAGLSGARNAGIKFAVGSYLGFVDSDDYIEPDMFKQMMQAAERSGADMVNCRANYVDENGKSIKVSPIINYSGSGFDFVKKDGVFNSNISCSKLYKCDLFDDIEFPVGRYYEDIFIMHKIFAKAQKVEFIDYIGYDYLRRQGSISLNKASVNLLDKGEAVLNRIEYLLEIGASDKALENCLKMYYSVWLNYYLVTAFKDQKIKKGLDQLNLRYGRLNERMKKIRLSASMKIRKTLFDLNPVSYCKFAKMAKKMRM